MMPVVITAGMLTGEDFSFGNVEPPPSGGGSPGVGGPLRETVTIEGVYDSTEELGGDVDDRE